MPEYIDPPIETDPETLAELAFDYLQSVITDWAPNDANLETILLEANARIAAEVRELASAVPSDIFRYYGSLAGIAPTEAARATTTTDWTMINNAGYTIPTGTLVGIRTAGDELVTFEVQTTTVVPAGQTQALNVPIIAIDPGAASSGIGAVNGPVELITILDFVTVITQDALTSGGVDAETTDAFLDKLRTRLQTLADRPILPDDFAILALNIVGIERAVALDLYQPGTNEKQTVRVDNGTGGTFTLTFAGQTTAPIAYNATAATIQAALEALSNINPLDIIVTGGPVNTVNVTIEFENQYRYTNVAQLTADGAALIGAGVVVVINTTVAGVAALNNVERAVTVVVVDDAGNGVTAAKLTETDTYLEGKRETNFLVYVINPWYTIIDVTFTAVALPGYDLIDVETRAEDAVREYLSPDNWGLVPSVGDIGEPRSWANKTVVRYLELAEVVNRVEGIDYIAAGGLTLGIQGQALAAADVNLVGPAPLPKPGNISGTVNP